MRKGYFQAFGVVVLLFASPYLIGALVAFSQADEPLPQRFSRLVVAGFAFLVGVGLLNLRKWAALYFSLPLFWVGLSISLSAVKEIAFPWNLFGMAYGVSLTLPLYVTIRVWSRLSWGGYGISKSARRLILGTVPEQSKMVCEHLSPLEKVLLAEGIAVTFRGQAWSMNCREWVYFDCFLDTPEIRNQIPFPDCVLDHSHRGTHDGQERGLVCTLCDDAIMGLYEPVVGKSIFPDSGGAVDVR
jgi:hypothetical protein